jgi:CO/xanthine dehydrogenase FAD-binding subunit
VKGVEFADDALASAWYREQMLPVLVARVLAELKEG